MEEGDVSLSSERHQMLLLKTFFVFSVLNYQLDIRKLGKEPQCQDDKIKRQAGGL